MDNRSTIQMILQRALLQATERNARGITDMYLVLGEISQYNAESFKLGWSELSRGSIAENAGLHFRHVAAEFQCMSCFTRYHPNRGRTLCPRCGGTGARILAGEECYMEACDVE